MMQLPAHTKHQSLKQQLYHHADMNRPNNKRPVDRSDSLSFGKIFKMPTVDLKSHLDDFVAPLAREGQAGGAATATHSTATTHAAFIGNIDAQPRIAVGNRPREENATVPTALTVAPIEFEVEEQKKVGGSSFDDVWRNIQGGSTSPRHQNVPVKVNGQHFHQPQGQYHIVTNQQVSAQHPSPQQVSGLSSQSLQQQLANMGNMSRLLHYNSGRHDSLPLLHQHLIPSVTQRSNELHALFDQRKSTEIAEGWTKYTRGSGGGLASSPSSMTTSTGQKRKMCQLEKAKMDALRMEKNRESAKRSRQRRAQYTKELEEKIEELNEINYAIRVKIRTEILFQADKPTPSKFNVKRRTHSAEF